MTITATSTLHTDHSAPVMGIDIPSYGFFPLDGFPWHPMPGSLVPY